MLVPLLRRLKNELYIVGDRLKPRESILTFLHFMKPNLFTHLLKKNQIPRICSFSKKVMLIFFFSKNKQTNKKPLKSFWGKAELEMRLKLSCVFFQFYA